MWIDTVPKSLLWKLQVNHNKASPAALSTLFSHWPALIHGVPVMLLESTKLCINWGDLRATVKLVSLVNSGKQLVDSIVWPYSQLILSRAITHVNYVYCISE